MFNLTSITAAHEMRKPEDESRFVFCFSSSSLLVFLFMEEMKIENQSKTCFHVHVRTRTTSVIQSDLSRVTKSTQFLRNR